MIKNLWGAVTVYCLCHEPPVEMEFKEGPVSVFYRCPEYDKRYHGGRGCRNRVSTDDFEGILNKLSDKITQDELAGKELNLTNYEFTYRGIQCKVLRHEDTHFSLGIRNPKALA